MILLYFATQHALAFTPLWVYAPDQIAVKELQSLPLGFAESRSGNWLRMDSDEEGITALRMANIPFTYAPQPIRSVPAGYTSPSEMNVELRDLANEYPTLTTLHSLGYSLNGRQILGLHIAENPDAALSYRILAAHHGDELPSGELALEFAKHILSESQSNTEIQDFLDHSSIWVVPHVNPDGVEAVRRYNSNDVDLNRNYGYMWNANEYRPGDGPFSEIETQNIRQFGNWNSAAAALSLHAGATNIGWVWNYTTQRASDDIVVGDMAKLYGDNCTQNNFWITNGADWYVTYGDTTDWSYGAFGVFDFTLEVSSSKQPPSYQLPDIFEAHLASMESFVLWPFWVSATVVDEMTSNPIVASIQTENNDTRHVGDPYGHVSILFSDLGTQQLTVTSPGYQSIQLNATVGQSLGTIRLSPLNILARDPSHWIHTQGDDIRFRLDETDDVQLVSAGQADVEMQLNADIWSADSDELRPGFYHIEHNEGFSPNSILLQSENPATELDSISFSDQQLEIESSNLGEGFSVWAVTVSNRNLIQLERSQYQNDIAVFLIPDTVSIEESLFALKSHSDIIALSTIDSIPDTAVPTDTSNPNEPDVETQPSSEPEPAEENSELDGNDEESIKAGCQTVPIQLPFILSILLIGTRRRC